jgi:hypothetical protein
LVAALKTESDVDVQVVNGNRGEFTVSVNGQVVAQKTDDLLPVAQIVQKVRQAKSAA